MSNAKLIEVDIFNDSICKMLEKLVIQYNKGFRAEVIRIKENYHQQIRNLISNKTGLSLTYKENETLNFDDNYEQKSQIKIEVVDDIPETLSEILEKHSVEVIELLFHYKKMKSVISEMNFNIINYSRYRLYHQNICSIKNLEHSKQYFLKLIDEVEKSGIIDDLKRTTPSNAGRYYPDKNTIEIYWLSLGLFGVLYELPIEHFTLITLIHELVHGYTHKGFDKDGNNWNTVSFKKADKHITEGFAQHYTYNICKNKFDFVLPTFEEFYRDSSSEYLLFKNWFSPNDKNIYEITRRVLLNTRAKNIVDYNSFLKELTLIKRDFKKALIKKTDVLPK